MDRVHTIRLEIPENDDLFNFLSTIENLHTNGSLLPLSILQQSNSPIPTVSFETTKSDFKQTLRQGNLVFGLNLTGREPVLPYAAKSSVDLGEIVQFVDIHCVSDALKNTTKTLNHWGINFSPRLIAGPEYQSFRTNLARRSNLYSYPTGEEWPFLLPCTDGEFETGITDESIERNPKFELVYSEYHPDPLIQFDIETALLRKEVEDLFPKPFGVSLIGLENMFRSVFIKNNWSGVLLRLDISFRQEKTDFGYWIVKNGKRY